ncbi:MAG: HAD hydrolase family protein, partial [Candidatus Bathyarchaeota archaeon]|nr:HAD hydrolase family protein [Candidatus Bathyarchaeota archaeon]
RVFISDCEGPISKNDNAFEITSHFVLDGDKLFTVISKYDDVLADVLKRPNYKAGCTLKLILPFLKTYEVTDNKMREFSAQSLVLISSAKDTLRHVRSVAYAFIVSTSYEHYIKALCNALRFPYENTYCTRVSIDKYHTTEGEKTKLKETTKEISQMPMIEIPSNAKSIKDFSEKDQETIQRLDEIFWKEIACTDCGRIFSEVNPVGGSEKAESIRDIIQKASVALADVMYVGDSITDVEAFRLVRENGGLTVSFNGNQYAIKNAEIAVLSENSIVTAVIADVFSKFGKQQTLSLIENWGPQALKKSPVNRTLLNSLFRLYLRELPKVKIITSENIEILAKESSEFRKKVRGATIGRLG